MLLTPKGRLIMSFLVISLVIVIGVAVVWTRPWHTPNDNSVRVGYLPIYVDLPLFVAEERGFFRDHCLEVRLHRFEASPDMSAALVGGRVDALASVATSSALAIETRDAGRFRIFLVDAETPQFPLSSLLVSSASRIRRVDQLRGKVIASFPGPTARLFAPLALERLGLPRDSYRIQELPIGSHLSALETGRVDAALTYEPTATQGVIKYHSRRLVPAIIETNVISPWQAGLWVISTRLSHERPEVAQRFVMAIYDAVRFIRSNPTEAKRALQRYTTIDPGIAEQTPNIPFTMVGEADLVTLQRHADLLTQHRILSRPVEIGPLIMPADTEPRALNSTCQSSR
jgi:NitT/TauT family transport system substrate-binding protein